MNNEERIRLGLEITGQEGLEDSARKTDALRKSMNDLLLAEMERGDAEVRLRTRKATLEREEQAASDAAVQQLVERTQAQKFFNEVMETSFTRTIGIKKSSEELGDTFSSDGRFGRGILQSSYAVQDFTSQLGTRGLAGGLAAVQNNIPGILAGLGAGAGLAGVISVVSVGAGLLYENWGKVSSIFSSTKEKLPDLTEGMDGLKDSLKDIGDQIEALEKQAKNGGLNLFDAEKLQKLRDIKQEGEQRQADDRLVSGIGANDSKAARAIAAAVKEALAETGGGESAARTLAMNAGLSGTEATAIVAGALRGNQVDVDTLLTNNPTVSARYKNPAQEAARKRWEERQKKEDAAIIQAADDEDRSREETDRAVQSAADVAQRIREQQEREQKRVADQAARDAERKAREQKHQADQAARDAAPDAVLRRQQEAEYQQAAAETMRLNRATGGTATAAAMQQIAREAVNQLPNTGGDMAAAVQMAVQMAYRKMQQDQAREWRRMQAQTEAFFGQ